MTTKQKAIRHYNRMIEWAKTQGDKVDKYHIDGFYVMRYYIGETVGSDYCSYCEKYHSACTICPLGYNSENNTCCDGLYIEMENSVTWREFVKKAEKVREYIRKNG